MNKKYTTSSVNSMIEHMDVKNVRTSSVDGIHVEKMSNKLVLVKEVIAKLRYFCTLYGVESLFVAGGYCRDYAFDNLENVNDIDVASAYHDQAVQLGGLFASEVLNTTPEFYKRTGTAVMKYHNEFGTIKVEFQGKSTNSYMYNEDVRTWLHDNKIDDVPMMNNIYGRDFTINAIIYSLKNDKFLDPTGQAYPDVENETLRSLLPANLLVKYNPVSVLRAIRFALTYNLNLDPDLRTAMKGSLDLLKRQLSEDRILKEMVRILKIGKSKALEMLKDYGLDVLLLHPDMKDHLYLGVSDE